MVLEGPKNACLLLDAERRRSDVGDVPVEEGVGVGGQRRPQRQQQGCHCHQREKALHREAPGWRQLSALALGNESAGGGGLGVGVKMAGKASARRDANWSLSVRWTARRS